MTEKLERHPLSAIWPDMTNADKYKLIADVKERGVIEKIVIYEGKILDGWHRYNAAWQAGRDTPLDDFIGDDPVGFVISRNSLRRHLSALQVAEAVVRCREWQPTGRPRSEADKPLHTTKQMAEEASVSTATVGRAKRNVLGHSPIEDRHIKIGNNQENDGKPLTKMQKVELENKRLKTELSEARGQVDLLTDQLKVYRDAASPSAAKREQTLTNKQNQIDALKAKNNRIVQELRNAKGERDSFHKEAKRLQALIDKNSW